MLASNLSIGFEGLLALELATMPWIITAEFNAIFSIDPCIHPAVLHFIIVAILEIYELIICTDIKVILAALNISYSEYRTIAKITANALVREIFLFADQNRDGELNMKEFLHWCKRGGSQVAVLKDILHHVVDDALLQDN